MDEADLPALYRAADKKAAERQSAFLRFQTIELVTLVGAAALAEPSWGNGDLNISALVSVVLLVGAMVTRLYLASTKPEQEWYDARAVAESTKTLAWQFAVGGEAFPLVDPDSKSRFLARIGELAARFPALDIPAGPGPDSQITPKMASVRDSLLSERRRIYRDARVLDQQDWYSRKADFNRKRARWWGRGLLLAEASAAALGLLRGIGLFDVDWSGLLAALAAAVLAWRQTKQYETLAESYAVTSHDVAALASKLDLYETESDWATAVHDSEAAFSREHTVWLARRQATPVT